MCSTQRTDGTPAGVRGRGRRARGRAPTPHCVRHKERDVIDHLPERDRDAVTLRLRTAWKETNHDRALEQLTRLAVELDRAHPGAAASLREGMEETLTVTRLGITRKLKQTLQSTNPIESMIATVRVIHRNVKNWSSGEMSMRWTAAGMLEAETRFRKVQGYRGLATIAVAIERDLYRRRHHLEQEVTTTATV
jgi:putative transposase